MHGYVHTHIFVCINLKHIYTRVYTGINLIISQVITLLFSSPGLKLPFDYLVIRLILISLRRINVLCKHRDFCHCHTFKLWNSLPHKSFQAAQTCLKRRRLDIHFLQNSFPLSLFTFQSS